MLKRPTDLPTISPMLKRGGQILTTQLNQAECITCYNIAGEYQLIARAALAVWIV